MAKMDTTKAKPLTIEEAGKIDAARKAREAQEREAQELVFRAQRTAGQERERAGEGRRQAAALAEAEFVVTALEKATAALAGLDHAMLHRSTAGHMPALDLPAATADALTRARRHLGRLREPGPEPAAAVGGI